MKLDNIKKSKLIDIFWEKCISGFAREIDELAGVFEAFSFYVPNLFCEQKNLLFEKIKCHNCGLDNYKNYTKLKNLLINNGVHNPDYKFILDAHDLGKNKDVIFVTYDENMVNCIIPNNILTQLRIDDFMVLDGKF